MHSICMAEYECQSWAESHLRMPARNLYNNPRAGWKGVTPYMPGLDAQRKTEATCIQSQVLYLNPGGYCTCGSIAKMQARQL